MSTTTIPRTNDATKSLAEEARTIARAAHDLAVLVQLRAMKAGAR